MILNTLAAKEMVDNDLELYRILLESYINDKILDEKKLLDLENSADKTEAGKYVHYFKGAARQLGGEELGEKAQRLEDVLKGKATGNIEELNKEFIEIYKITVEAMKNELKNLS